MNQARGTQTKFLLGGMIALVIFAVGFWWFSPGQQQKRRNSALIEAVRAGDLKAAEALLNAGADANSPDSDGITPLMHAARGERPNISNPVPTDHPEVIELLVNRGANVNAKTDSGFVALFWAARYGHVRVVRVLVAHGADVNARDKDGLTALKWAATNQQTNVIEFLKVSGAKE